MSENGKGRSALPHHQGNGNNTDGLQDTKNPNMPKPQNRDFDRNAEQRETDRQALDLKIQGISYRAIAKSQQCSHSVAHDRVMRALEWSRKHMAHKAQDWVDMMLAKLDKLEGPLFRRALGVNDDGTRGEPDYEAIEKILKIMARQAKLLGLDKPIKITPTNIEGDQPFELVLEILTIEQKRELIRRRGITVDAPALGSNGS